MAVLLETTRGDVVIDLMTEKAPTSCVNFVKLCKMKYYDKNLIFSVVKGFAVTTGDGESPGRDGSAQGISMHGKLYGEQARFFDREENDVKHTRAGMVGMVCGPRGQASHFYITTGSHLQSLDGKHTIFGEVAEGLDVIMSMDGEYVDERNRPFVNIRIKRCTVLDDPYPDPRGMDDLVPAASPDIEIDRNDTRLEDGWRPEDETKTAEEVEKSMRASEAKSRAVVLEMIGDLPDADAKPPEEFLFVCKLNPVTSDEDLEIIFSRFGTVTSCDVIRDKKTGESLTYAFVGFEKKEDAERAYFKMDGVLIDDRRIKVDFSQSMHHLWKQYRASGGGRAKEKSGDAHDRSNHAGPSASSHRPPPPLPPPPYPQQQQQHSYRRDRDREYEQQHRRADSDRRREGARSFEYRGDGSTRARDRTARRSRWS